MDWKAVENAEVSKQHKWAEADAAFLQRICSKKNMIENPSSSSSSSFGFETYRSNEIINYPRQRYLRSYKFSDEKQKATPFHKAKKLKSKSRCQGHRKHSRNAIFRFMFCCCVHEVDVYKDEANSTSPVQAFPDL